ncbi:MAG: hypothetical protein ACK4UN_04230 [Limisphaerales bacterium]
MDCLDQLAKGIEQILVLGGPLLGCFMNNGGNLLKGDGASLEVVTIDCPQNLFCNEAGKFVGLSVGTHERKIARAIDVGYLNLR